MLLLYVVVPGNELQEELKNLRCCENSWQQFIVRGKVDQLLDSAFIYVGGVLAFTLWCFGWHRCALLPRRAAMREKG